MVLLLVVRMGLGVVAAASIHERHEQGGSDECGEDSEGYLAWRESRSGEGIGNDEDDAAKEGACDDEAAVPGADETSCQVGNDESDKSDGAADGDGGGDGERGDDGDIES
jgi:hypothetical protein